LKSRSKAEGLNYPLTLTLSPRGEGIYKLALYRGKGFISRPSTRERGFTRHPERY